LKKSIENMISQIHWRPW